jgi:methylmalonyl-CoA carboxyltransferase large subunit
MGAEKLNSDSIAEALEALRQEVARLGERVAALEARAGSAPRATTPAQSKLPEAPVEELSEELLLVLSAAIAAYLGKKAPIRQIRLLRSDAWAQQGRTTIQASHALQPDRTRRTP